MSRAQPTPDSERKPLGVTICGRLKESLHPYPFPEPSMVNSTGSGARIPEQPLLAV